MARLTVDAINPQPVERMPPVLWRFGLIAANQRRLQCLSMFWHFLDLVWIGVFSFVYLMGSVR